MTLDHTSREVGAGFGAIASEPPPAADPSMLWFDGAVPVLKLPDGGFDAQRAVLREELPRLAGRLAGKSVRVDLGAREIALLDLRRILSLLRQEFSVDTTGLYLRREMLNRFAERELKLKVFVNDPAPEPIAAPVVVAEPAPAEVAAAPSSDPVPDAPPAPEAAVEVAGDGVAPEPVPSPAPVEVAAPEPELPKKAATPVPVAAREEGRRAQTIQRTLRSGTILRYDGDLYVMGDVNPGAQVIATGNIVVLGAIKGTAHAGSAGDESATILAFDLRPTQLRIARLIAIPPDRKADGELNPEIAQIKGDQVVIESYRGRTR